MFDKVREGFLKRLHSSSGPLADTRNRCSAHPTDANNAITSVSDETFSTICTSLIVNYVLHAILQFLAGITGARVSMLGSIALTAAVSEHLR